MLTIVVDMLAFRMKTRAGSLLLLGVTFGFAAISIYGQDTTKISDSESGRLLLRFQPSTTGRESAITSKLLTKLFQPDEIRAPVNAKIEDLSRSRCGRVDNGWIAQFRKANSLTNGDTVGTETKLVLPPCAFWGGPAVVAVGPGIGLSHELMLHVGSQGVKTLSAVALANGRSEGSLNHIKAGEKITLPYTTNFVSYTLRPEYRKDPKTAIAELRATSSLIEALPEGQLALVDATSDADCATTPDDSNYPFPVKDLIETLKFNSGRRQAVGKSLRMAVIGVIDSGIDAEEQRLYLNDNPGELTEPNGIDDDQNNYIDDIWGANLSAPGELPLRYPSDYDGFHGTYVAALTLGGLGDDQLNQLVKERIQVKILDVVAHETIAGSPPIERYPIWTASLANAFQYATKYNGKIPILNLSVETASNDAGISLAIQNSESLAIVAAGNDRKDLDRDEVYPAAIQEGLRSKLISVGASDKSGSLAAFSNWGKNTVDLAAPGCQIESILPEGRRAPMSGTSAAAPLVSFAAGLLYSEGLTLAQIKERILRTVTVDHDNLGVCSDKIHCVATEGRLDIVKALDIYEDVVTYKDSKDMIVTSKGRVKDTCIRLDGSCYAPTSQFVKLEQTSSGWQAWTISKGKQIHAENFYTIAEDMQFDIPGMPDPITIPMSRLIELVPAVWR